MKTVGVLTLSDELAQWEPHVTAASQKHGIPESLIYAVMERESGGGHAPGTHDLCGDWTARKGHWLGKPHTLLVQTLPDGWRPPRDKDTHEVLPPPYSIPEDRMGWGRWLMQLDYETVLALEAARGFDWSDPMQNIDAGASILRTCIDMFPGNLRAAIAAYNCGPANVRKALLAGKDEDAFTTGHDYSADVLRRQKSFLQEPAT